MIRAEVSPPRPDLVARLLAALPDWFGQPDANEQYVRDAAVLPTLVARDGASDVGVLLYRPTLPGVVDVHLLAVDPAHHRSGAGSALIELLTGIADTRTITVATLGPSDPDPFYAGTRAFYEARGFVAVEERADVWPGTPRVVMVRKVSDTVVGSIMSSSVEVIDVDDDDQVEFGDDSFSFDSTGDDDERAYGLPVVRTFFADDSDWAALQARLGEPDETGYAPPFTFVDDHELAGADADTVITWLAEQGGVENSCECVALADAHTFVTPDRALLVVSFDEDDDPRSFRCMPGELGAVEANLSLSNLDFVDFSEGARSGELDGVSAAESFTAPSTEQPSAGRDPRLRHESGPDAAGRWPAVPVVESTRRRAVDLGVDGLRPRPEPPPVDATAFVRPTVWLVVVGGDRPATRPGMRVAGPFATYLEAHLFREQIAGLETSDRVVIVALESPSVGAFGRT